MLHTIFFTGYFWGIVQGGCAVPGRAIDRDGGMARALRGPAAPHFETDFLGDIPFAGDDRELVPAGRGNPGNCLRLGDGPSVEYPCSRRRGGEENTLPVRRDVRVYRDHHARRRIQDAKRLRSPRCFDPFPLRPRQEPLRLLDAIVAEDNGPAAQALRRAVLFLRRQPERIPEASVGKSPIGVDKVPEYNIRRAESERRPVVCGFRETGESEGPQRPDEGLTADQNEKRTYPCSA